MKSKGTIQVKRWNMIRYVLLRHTKVLLRIIIERRISDQRDRRRPRTLYIKKNTLECDARGC